MNLTENILDSMDRIKPFPQVVVRALHLLEDPDLPASKIVEVVKYDPVITVRLLQVCNSALFGLKRRVESLQQAMLILGSQAMMRLIVAFGALDLLKDQLPGYGLERGELLDHAVACATLSQTLLRELNFPEDHAVFTGAILHDVGKLVLNEYAGRQYWEISRMVEDEGHSAIEAERAVLGVDHAQVGAELARRWNLPQSIVVVILRHHDSVSLLRDPLAVCLVHLANVMCVQLGIGAGTRGLANRPSAELLQSMGWSPKKLDACLSAFWCDLEKARGLLNLPSERAEGRA